MRTAPTMAPSLVMPLLYGESSCTTSSKSQTVPKSLGAKETMPSNQTKVLEETTEDGGGGEPQPHRRANAGDGGAGGVAVPPTGTRGVGPAPTKGP